MFGAGGNVTDVPRKERERSGLYHEGRNVSDACRKVKYNFFTGLLLKYTTCGARGKGGVPKKMTDLMALPI
jgi:hypothetical protein